MQYSTERKTMEANRNEQILAEMMPHLQALQEIAVAYKINGFLTASFDFSGYMSVSCPDMGFRYTEFGKEVA